MMKEVMRCSRSGRKDSSFRLLIGMIGWMTLCSSLLGDMPSFESDQQLDQWLRENSRTYRSMATFVDHQGGVEIVRAKEARDGDRITPVPKGFTFTDDGQRKIILNPSLEKGAAASVLIFEMTNHFQEGKHAEINSEVIQGTITSGDEYAILRQLVEFDGLRLHRVVLTELESNSGTLTPEFFSVFPTAARKLADYELPSVYFLIKTEKQSGHRDYYKGIFQGLSRRALEIKAREDEKERAATPS